MLLRYLIVDLEFLVSAIEKKVGRGNFLKLFVAHVVSGVFFSQTKSNLAVHVDCTLVYHTVNTVVLRF